MQKWKSQNSKSKQGSPRQMAMLQTLSQLQQRCRARPWTPRILSCMPHLGLWPAWCKCQEGQARVWSLCEGVFLVVETDEGADE